MILLSKTNDQNQTNQIGELGIEMESTLPATPALRHGEQND
jgi:hypothetical protein